MTECVDPRGDVDVTDPPPPSSFQRTPSLDVGASLRGKEGKKMKKSLFVVAAVAGWLEWDNEEATFGLATVGQSRSGAR